jgi:hypothetical protein
MNITVINNDVINVMSTLYDCDSHDNILSGTLHLSLKQFR